MAAGRKRNLHLDKWLAVAIGAALAVGFLLSQRPHPPVLPAASAAAVAPVAVATSVSAAVPVPVYAEGIGTVWSRLHTEIASRLLAEVKEVRVQPGDAVAQGDVLVVLDSLDLRARVEQAEATLRSLEENLGEARTEFERTRNLHEKEAATQQALDAARFRLAEVVAKHQAAAKALEEARIQLGYATVTAPFAGLIYRKQIEPGDLASPGKPLLGLYDPARLRLETLVEERIVRHVALHDRIEIRISALDHSLVGEVSEIVPAVDPFTRTGTVKLDLPDDAALRPGMFGRARVPIDERTAVVVPAAAVVRRGQLTFVFAIEAGGGGGPQRVRLRLVRAGAAVEPSEGKPRTEILSGLDAGVRLALPGEADLWDGAPVVEAAGGAPAEQPAPAGESTEEKR